MGYSNLLAEDKKLVTYRPRLNEVTGSVTATVLLQQIIFHADNVGNRPFYKFRAPCRHKLYREGDSWTEELGFSPAEFDTARSKIATRVKKGDSKTEALKGETANHLVIYWTDASRVTWYMLNVDLLNRILEKLYADSRNSNYQESGESPNSENQDSENIRKLEKEDLPLSETPPEIPTEDTEKTPDAFPKNPDQPQPNRKERTDENPSTDHPDGRDSRSDGLGTGGSQPAQTARADDALPDRRGDDAGAGKADPAVESVITQTETHPDEFDLARATLAHREAAGGNYAAPPTAGGDDGAASTAMAAMYRALDSEPPREGSDDWKEQIEVFSQTLRDRGVKDVAVAEKAGELMGTVNLETPHFANPRLSSFPAAFGIYVGRAKKQADDTFDRRARDVEAMEASLDALEERRAARPPPARDDKTGRAVKDELELQMSRPTFDTWVKPACFTCEDGLFVVTARNKDARDWLDSHLRQIIERTAVGVLGQAVEVRFEAGEPLAVAPEVQEVKE